MDHESPKNSRHDLLEHEPLKRWSPLTPSERRATRAFVDRLSAFPYLTVGTVVFLGWAYLVQLVLSWPLTWVLPPSLPIDASISESLGSHLGWLAPEPVLAGEWWRLLSGVMLHGSVLHVFGNCFVLYVLGRIVENAFGKPAFATVFVFSGITGSALSLLTGVEASLGASGAVLGLLGASLALGMRHRDRIPRALHDYFRLDLWVFVVLVAAMSALPFVDWAGHLGGFLCGLLLGLLWPPVGLEGPEGHSSPVLGQMFALLSVAAVALTLGQVTERVVTVGETTVLEDLRALRAAMERGDREAQRLIVLEIVDGSPRSAGDLWGMLLLEVGEYERAVDALLGAESANPVLANSPPPYWDNNLAWAIFRARGDQPRQVEDGLRRTRRAMKADADDPIVRNTLAYGLLLSGRHREAESVITEVMLAKPAEERGPDVFIKVMALLGMQRRNEALGLFEESKVDFPDEELLPETEERLREAGLLPGG